MQHISPNDPLGLLYPSSLACNTIHSIDFLGGRLQREFILWLGLIWLAAAWVQNKGRRWTVQNENNNVLLLNGSIFYHMLVIVWCVSTLSGATKLCGWPEVLMFLNGKLLCNKLTWEILLEGWFAKNRKKMYSSTQWLALSPSNTISTRHRVSMCWVYST